MTLNPSSLPASRRFCRAAPVAGPPPFASSGWFSRACALPHSDLPLSAQHMLDAVFISGASELNITSASWTFLACPATLFEGFAAAHIV